MSFTSNNASSSSPGWDHATQDRQFRGQCGFSRWRPLEILAMILGFMLFWPIGLAVIAFKIWQRRSGYQGDLFQFAEQRAGAMRNACEGWRGHQRRQGFTGGWGPRPTGNTAFDDWRASELARLQEELRKVEAAEKEFAEHIDNLRRARDREEFDAFMRARQSRGPDATGPAAP